MNNARRGVILPIILVSIVLLATMVITFQFISSTDYKQVGRLVRSIQAACLADLASDEVFMQIGTIAVGTSDPKPAWITDLLAALDGARSGATPSPSGRLLNVKQSLDFSDKVPVTMGAAGKTNGLVDVASVKVVMGPFLATASGYEPALYYAEPAFSDGPKDRLAWDLRGPFSVEVATSGAKGPFEFNQKFLRGQELQLTDTKPPAAEFALFSYLPPPNDEYALNDLQRGGRITVIPSPIPGQPGGRVMLRGPLLLLPEDAQPDKVFLGGEKPATSPTFPEKNWTSWSTIPGPRAIQHAQNSGSTMFDALLANLKSLVPELTAGMSARRPLNERSDSEFTVKAFRMTATVNVPILGTVTKTFNVPPIPKIKLGQISVVMGADVNGPDATYQTIDKDGAAYYPPGAYLHAVLPAGKQLFYVKPRPAVMYRSALVPAPATEQSVAFQAGTRASQEGDALVVEPIGKGAGPEAGPIGLYGVGVFDSKTYSSITAKNVARWMVQKAANKIGGIIKDIIEANKESLANQVLSQLRIDPNILMIIRRFTVTAPTGWPTPPPDLDQGTVSGLLGAKNALIAPYGFYWHEESFWDSGSAPPALKPAMIDAVRRPLVPWNYNTALSKFIRRGGTNAWQEAEAAIAGTVPDVVGDVKTWLSGDHSDYLLRNTAGKSAGGPDQALRAILEAGARSGTNGLAPVSPDRFRRPQGAFGDYSSPAGTASAEVKTVAGQYAGGFFPPKYRDWEAITTRTYPDLTSYLAAESKNGVLELRGAVFVQKLNGAGKSIAYRGRGILVTVTEDDTSPPVIDGKVGPAPGAVDSELILAHRISRKLADAGTFIPLKLGSEFTGSVYSDTGVAPAGGQTKINGNLVTGLLNKKAIGASSAPDDGVNVYYREAFKAAATGPMAPYWAVEMGGEVLSVQPGS